MDILPPTGIVHQQPRTGRRCPYLAEIFCNKCGWVEPPPEPPKGM